MSASTSPPWRLVIEFTCLDLDDDDVVDALVGDASLHIEWSSSEGVTTAEATITARSPREAFETVREVVESAAPDAHVFRITDPLVTTSDIADEAGVTRQAVRNWSLGTRHAGFPRPLAIVGDGVRIWRQAEVDAWLVASVNLGLGCRFPTPTFIASFNEQIVTRTSDEGGGDDFEGDDGWHVASSRTEFQHNAVEKLPSQPRKRAGISANPR